MLATSGRVRALEAELVNARVELATLKATVELLKTMIADNAEHLAAALERSQQTVAQFTSPVPMIGAPAATPGFWDEDAEDEAWQRQMGLLDQTDSNELIELAARQAVAQAGAEYEIEIDEQFGLTALEPNDE